MNSELIDRLLLLVEWWGC